MWQYRYLLMYLIWRDIKVRYKQAFFGVAWAIVSPLIQVTVFTFIFGGIFRLSTGQTNYFPIVLVGFTFWNFLSQCITSTLVALVTNTDLITKVKFPKIILVISAVGGRIPDLIVTFVFSLFLLLFLQPFFIPNLFWFAILFMTLILLAVGIGLILSVTNVYFRDITAVIPVFITVWLFLTPVVYPLSSVPANYMILARVNPVTGILEGMRNVLITNQPPDLLLTLTSIALSVGLLIFGFLYFSKLEKNLADII